MKVYREWYRLLNYDIKLMSILTSENANCYLLKPADEWFLYSIVSKSVDYCTRCLYCRDEIVKDEDARANVFIKYHNYNLLIRDSMRYLNKKEWKKHSYHIDCYDRLFGIVSDI